MKVVEQVPGALTGAGDLVVAGPRAPGRATAPGQVGVTQDDTDDIVEIVGYAAGECADGLKFLGLGELRLEGFFPPELLAPGDVVDDGKEQLPAPDLDRAAEYLHIADRAVGAAMSTPNRVDSEVITCRICSWNVPAAWC